MLGFTKNLNDRLLFKKLLKLIIFINLTPALFVIFTSGYMTYQSLSASTSYNNELVAVNLANDIDDFLLEKEHLLSFISNLPEIQSMDPVKQVPILQDTVKKYNNDFTTIFIANTSGQQIARDSGDFFNVSDRQYFKDIISGQNFSISDILISKLTNQPIAIISVPIKKNDIIIGVISAPLKLSRIDELVNYNYDMKHSQTCIFVADNNGHVISHPDNTIFNDLSNVKTLAPIKASQNQISGSVKYADKGKNLFASYAKSKKAKWIVVVQEDEDNTLSFLKKQIFYSISTLLLVGMISVYATYLIYKSSSPSKIN